MYILYHQNQEIQVLCSSALHCVICQLQVPSTLSWCRIPDTPCV
jgi:hypothetical protein